jgi:hypothetical protein
MRENETLFVRDFLKEKEREVQAADSMLVATRAENESEEDFTQRIAQRGYYLRLAEVAEFFRACIPTWQEKEEKSTNLVSFRIYLLLCANQYLQERAKDIVPTESVSQEDMFVALVDAIEGLIKDIEKDNKKPRPVCNYCGHTCLIGEGRYRSAAGLIGASVSGGYESTPGNGYGALDDLTSYPFNICEFCLDRMFQEFVIPPTLRGDGDEEFVPAKDRECVLMGGKFADHFHEQSALRDRAVEDRRNQIKGKLSCLKPIT